MKGPSHPDDNQEVQLGRNLAAAFIATCHGIGSDYARKKYASQPVGEYWIALARKVIADLSNRSHQGAHPQRPVMPAGTCGKVRSAGSRIVKTYYCWRAVV